MMDEVQVSMSAHSVHPTNRDKSCQPPPLSTCRLMQLTEPSTVFGRLDFLLSRLGVAVFIHQVEESSKLSRSDATSFSKLDIKVKRRC